jgi:microsomal prostaglandin-E synthase 1
MTNLASQPAFIAYAVSVLILSLNMLLLWAYSGTVRGKTKTTPNKEDAGTIAKGSQLVEADPPEVARVLRAHKNATASVVPFMVLGLVYVLAGGSGTVAEWVFGHSFAYVGGRQPWRSVFFTIGGGATLALMGFLVRTLVAANA